MLTLYIGNKNYSSWSMRSGVLLNHFGIPYKEKVIRFDGFGPGSKFRASISKLTPVGKVPLLQDGKLFVWDTLAIAEYLAESFSDKPFWPRGKAARARARSICAEMHSGFTALRSNCPMNIEADLKEVGALILRDKSAVVSDVKRIEAMWTELLQEHGGPFLFGKDFGIADAYFAPVCMRFVTYGLTKNKVCLAYMKSVSKAHGVKQWIADALAEKDFRDFEEPYRLKP